MCSLSLYNKQRSCTDPISVELLLSFHCEQHWLNKEQWVKWSEKADLELFILDLDVKLKSGPDDCWATPEQTLEKGRNISGLFELLMENRWGTESSFGRIFEPQAFQVYLWTECRRGPWEWGKNWHGEGCRIEWIKWSWQCGKQTLMLTIFTFLWRI